MKKGNINGMMKAFESDTVIIKDLEVKACHGVNADEKVVPQRFLISCEIELNCRPAAETDDINLTVNYSLVKKFIVKFVSENCFNLIETLAVRIAEGILCGFEIVRAVKVTVKKPDAPMSGIFDYVAVEASLIRHKVFLSLGSNLGDREEHLNYAVKALIDDGKNRLIKRSRNYVSEPYGGVADKEFLNCAIELETYLSPSELLRVINKIEAERDRTRDVRWGNRTLDVDILFYDDYIIEEDTLAVPHVDIENRLFVLEPLFEIAPNKVNPLNGKRVSEMLKNLRQF